MIKLLAISSLSCLLLAGMGCKSSEASKEKLGTGLKTMREQKRSVPSTIVHVNEAHGFVLLENYLEHEAGTVLGVFRGEGMIGRVRITRPARKNLISADILAGTIQRGDTAYLE